MSNYRIIKKSVTWWTSLFDNGGPVYLYWDADTDHFEVASHGVARKHKWVFDDDGIEAIRHDFPDFDEHFVLERIKRGEE